MLQGSPPRMGLVLAPAERERERESAQKQNNLGFLYPPALIDTGSSVSSIRG